VSQHQKNTTLACPRRGESPPRGNVSLEKRRGKEKTRYAKQRRQKRRKELVGKIKLEAEDTKKKQKA
jgi:hypothetical protein